MNPLPRLLGMALFVLLAVLTALLAVPVWQRRGSAPAAESSSLIAGGTSSTTTAATANAKPFAPAAAYWQRTVLVVALVALGLAGALLFSLALRPTAGSAVDSTVIAARQEMGALAKLAENSVAQGVELSRERDVRRRAEEDAQLKQQLLAQSLDEKIRLGRDLHDGIIQSLYAAGLTLETIRPLLRSDPEQAERRLEDIRVSLNAAIRDVRSYITGLAPDNLRRASFSRAVAALFEQLRAGRMVKLAVDIDDDAAAALTVEQSAEALQIAREAISNALRHGEATAIELRMHKGDGEIGLLVRDNGRGFDAERACECGHGLTNMRARAERLGAKLRITSQPNQGARVIATFPTREPTTP